MAEAAVEGVEDGKNSRLKMKIKVKTKMKRVTLCLLMKEGKILLAMKKRGFGMGRWNGVGGKVNEDENIETAAAREVREEIGIKVKPENLVPSGKLKFYFRNKPEWDQEMHIFLAKDWVGESRESEEMKPQWFDIDKMPYESMWPDDKYWLPLFVKGKNVAGEFHFSDDGNNFENYKINEI